MQFILSNGIGKIMLFYKYENRQSVWEISV